MRFDRRLGPGTRIEVVTEGLLTRRLQADPALEPYGLVIFDEFHERSLDADLGFALCLEVQSALRPDLRLLCMSATLDGTELARHLGHAPVIRSRGHQYPVAIRHLGDDPAEPLERRVARAVEMAPASGSILVFLPGAREIRRAAEVLVGRLPDVPVHALHGDLPKAAQDAALRPAPGGGRRIVLATNIAETSLTIEGVSVVVDCGLERRSRFSARTGMSRLVTVPISRASAEQRAGRAGRQGPGLCYRLWSVEAERGMAAHRPAEIEEADLAPLALELAAWGVADPARLRLPTQPPAGPFAQARGLLLELGALAADGSITAHGRAMALLPLHPRLAHMTLMAAELDLAPTALAVAALLGARDPDRVDADLARRLTLLRPGGEPDRVRRQLARSLGIAVGEPDPEMVGPVTSLAFPDRVAQARPGGRGAYLLANGRGARLDPRDPLAVEPWLAVAELDDAGSEAKIRLAAPLSFALGGENARRAVRHGRGGPVRSARGGHDCPSHGASGCSADPRAAAVADPALVAAAWCEVIRSRGLPWTDAARQVQGRIALLRRRAPTAWPDWSEASLLATLEEWLAPHLGTLRRLAELDGLDLRAILLDLLDHTQRRDLDRLAPTHLDLASGRRAAIDYAQNPPGSGGQAAGAVRTEQHTHHRPGSYDPDPAPAVTRAAAAGDHPRPGRLLGYRVSGGAQGAARTLPEARLAGRPPHAVGYGACPPSTLEVGRRPATHILSMLVACLIMSTPSLTLPARHASIPWLRMSVACWTWGAGDVICSRRAGTSDGNARPKSLAALKQAAGSRPSAALAVPAVKAALVTNRLASSTRMTWPSDARLRSLIVYPRGIARKGPRKFRHAAPFGPMTGLKFTIRVGQTPARPDSDRNAIGVPGSRACAAPLPDRQRGNPRGRRRRSPAAAGFQGARRQIRHGALQQFERPGQRSGNSPIHDATSASPQIRSSTISTR